eukprot:726803-Rhodomonas_salina.3
MSGSEIGCAAIRRRGVHLPSYPRSVNFAATSNARSRLFSTMTPGMSLRVFDCIVSSELCNSTICLCICVPPVSTSVSTSVDSNVSLNLTSTGSDLYWCTLTSTDSAGTGSLPKTADPATIG